MNYKRIAIAAVAAWFLDLIYGVVVWSGVAGPQMAGLPGVFRSHADQMAHLPITLVGSVVGMFVLAIIYAKGYDGGNGWAEGFRFGLLMGAFSGAFVGAGIYGSFDISSRMAVYGVIISFFEMLVVCTLIGGLYHPARNAVPEASEAVAG